MGFGKNFLRIAHSASKRSKRGHKRKGPDWVCFWCGKEIAYETAVCPYCKTDNSQRYMSFF